MKDEIKLDLIKLIKKHKLKAGSFCAIKPNNEFYGLTLIEEGEKFDIRDLMEAVIAVGRLWQHSRSLVRQILGDFEKKWEKGE